MAEQFQRVTFGSSLLPSALQGVKPGGRTAKSPSTCSSLQREGCWLLPSVLLSGPSWRICFFVFFFPTRAYASLSPEWGVSEPHGRPAGLRSEFGFPLPCLRARSPRDEAASPPRFPKSPIWKGGECVQAAKSHGRVMRSVWNSASFISGAPWFRQPWR